ncbi:MAG: NRAMP family divalent metal transporter [Chitinophagaceae bacterium]
MTSKLPGNKYAAGIGAAFLMATSAIGPGFITQSVVFTQQLFTSFAFVILISIVLDIAAQLNIWRIICVSGLRAQDLANKVLPGAGYVLAILVVLGGIAFNIGNIGGCGLGVNVMTGMDTTYGAIISGVIALFIFWFKEFGKSMDLFTKILGVVMLLLTLYVALQSHPPVMAAIKHSIMPEKIDARSIVTLVGGTVGGYISFAGAHRLLDSGTKGVAALPQITRGSVLGIVMASAMRILLFLAALGVVAAGVVLSNSNPAETVFSTAAGNIGRVIFGLVLWAAAITSVVGAAYTSVSFLRSFHPWLEANNRWLIIGFIILSTVLFVLIQKPPKEILVMVGALNGLILPVSLGLMLLASHRRKLFGNYQHPLWLRIAGWAVVVLMGWMGVVAFT